MTSSNALKTAVIAGIGNGSGTGAATARLFAKQGFRVALIARNPDDLNKFAKSIQDDGGIAAAFPIAAYDHTSLSSAFKAIEQKWPSEVGKSGIKFALWNAGSATFGKFLEIDEAKLKEGIDTTVIGSFAFGQEVVRAILASTGEAEAQQGHRGTLIFTGATAALRGGAGFGAFAAGKFGVRAISQSIAREFGKEGIHVAHAIIDGGIFTEQGKVRRAGNSEQLAAYDDERKRLSPESIAKSYWYLYEQDPSAWTQELDLRPAHEKF